MTRVICGDEDSKTSVPNQTSQCLYTQSVCNSRGIKTSHLAAVQWSGSKLIPRGGAQESAFHWLPWWSGNIGHVWAELHKPPFSTVHIDGLGG